MSKHRKSNRSGVAGPAKSSARGARKIKPFIVVFLIAALAALAVWIQKGRSQNPGNVSVSPSNAPAIANADLPTNEVAHALMVTVELNFGGPPPSLKDAVAQIERRYEPAAGTERTFAILDAYGTTNENNMLHLSMHLSMERPGIGALVFRRTGEVLWKSKIAPSPAGPPGAKNLTVLVEDAEGKTQMLDGSKGIMQLLDVPLDRSISRVRDIWPDGAEREWTFIYSACGCPVKTKVRRVGETTMRTSEWPVMFPDDPAAMEVINRLMGWR